jgi:hypothetical protein
MEQIIVIDIEKQLSRNRPFKPLKNETKGFGTEDDRTIVRQIIRVYRWFLEDKQTHFFSAKQGHHSFE